MSIFTAHKNKKKGSNQHHDNKNTLICVYTTHTHKYRDVCVCARARACIHLLFLLILSIKHMQTVIVSFENINNQFLSKLKIIHLCIVKVDYFHNFVL